MKVPVMKLPAKSEASASVSSPCAMSAAITKPVDTVSQPSRAGEAANGATKRLTERRMGSGMQNERKTGAAFTRTDARRAPGEGAGAAGEGILGFSRLRLHAGFFGEAGRPACAARITSNP